MTTRLLVFNGTTSRDAPQPFGVEALDGLDYDQVVARSTPLPRKVRDVVHHRWGVRVDQLGWREARRADLVLAYLEPNIAYPAAMRRMPWSPLRGTPLVGIFCWAAEELLTADEQRRRRVQRMLRACDVVAFFSRNQEEIFVEHGVARERLAALPFGIDIGQFPRGTGEGERDIDLLSVGWDRGRDYETLARAVAGTGVRTTVVAPPHRFASDPPSEIDLVGTVSHPEYRSLLRRARVVVVPTHDLAYPTGQTVAMEAAAAGCAVVVSRTAAMEDYFTDGATAEMPEVGDVADLRDRLLRLLREPERRRTLASRSVAHAHEHFDQSVLWRALDDELRERGLVPESSPDGYDRPVPLLVVVPPGPVDLRDGGFTTTAKFADGMAMYADLWPGDVMVLGPPADTSDTSNLGAVTLALGDLPYRVETTTDLVGGLGATGADVALLPLDERLADVVGVARRTVLAAEHTGRSRLEMVLAEPVPPLDRLRAEIGFRRLTPRLKRLVSRADGVQCNGQVAWLAYAGHSPAPLRMYDSRVRLADVHTARARNEPWTGGRTLRLGFSGRMIPIKGPAYAIEAHRRLRAAGIDVSLAMFGDGELRTRLEQEAPDVRFHGSLDFATEWCPTVASSIDLMVLPHLQSDPAGTYLESAGMGVPVIGFDNVALDHLVEVGGLGWTSPPRRADLLARRIEQLMATPDELVRARHAGTDFMTDHCFEKDFGARVQHLHDVLRSGVQ